MYIMKKHETVTDNLPIRICVNQIENRSTFRIKTEYCLERLIPEIIKLLGITKSKVTNNENSENVPLL